MSEGSFHDLFPPEDEHHKPVPIKAIYVKRFETSGMVSALRPFAPEELKNEGDLFQMFGGGTYQLQARDERGGVIRTLRTTIPGPKKSMLGDVGSEAPEEQPRAASSNGIAAPGSMQDFLMMQISEMREERMAAREREERREERERERDRNERAAREADQRTWMAMVIDAMKGGSGLTEKLLDRALQPAAQATQPRDPFGDAKAAVEFARALKKGGGDDTETISTVAQAVAMGLASLAELAKAGDQKQRQDQQQQLSSGQQQQQQAPPESQEQPQHEQQGAVG